MSWRKEQEEGRAKIYAIWIFVSFLIGFAFPLIWIITVVGFVEWLKLYTIEETRKELKSGKISRDSPIKKLIDRVYFYIKLLLFLGVVGLGIYVWAQFS